MPSRRQVVVAYGGVHQAYQIALACQEADCLERFYCSWLVAPGKWGRVLNKLSGGGMGSWAVEGIPSAKVVEHPWPYLVKRITDRISPASQSNWLPAHESFDRRVARRLERDQPAVFVGTETCDLFALESAKKKGATTVHDCPQIHPVALASLMREAADKAGMAGAVAQAPANPRMEARKLAEYQLADHLMVYSDFHRRTFEAQGFPSERIFQCPLWVHGDFWTPGPALAPKTAPGPLRILFIGSLTLRKGLPFLVDSVNRLGKAVSLTLVGPAGPETAQLLSAAKTPPKVLGALPKAAVQEQCHLHDVLVLPSVADSFGFVALEAMACGLPVLLSDNCGAPAPVDSRIPAMDADALTARLESLVAAPHQLEMLQAQSREFALQYTARRYRQNVGTWLASLARAQA